jgi:REP-associated tyrosine transposase
MERYRIHGEAAVYYLTYSIVDWLPVFVSQPSCTIVTDSLSFCHREKNVRINAYVIMPTHVHLIVFDGDLDSERLARSLADFRKYTGRQLSDYCSDHGPKCFRDVLRDQADAEMMPRL